MATSRIYLSRIKKEFLKKGFKFYDSLMGTDKYIRYRHWTNGFHNSNYQFKKDQIGFIHLPKTGGTSFNKILNEEESNIFVNLNIHKPVSNNCKPKDYKYVTIMRNPITRVWSQYQHVLREDTGYPYQKFAKQGLNQFLEKCWAVRNMNCRYLVGEIDIEPNEETFQTAQTNLAHFYRILSFEDFKDEVISFLEEHQISFGAIPNERKSNYLQPNKEEIVLIKKYNQLDIRLFEEWRMKRTLENRER